MIPVEKRKKNRQYLRAKSLAHALLTVVALGGVAFVVLVAPNALQILGRQYGRDEWWSRREAERRRVHEALERLRRKRLVAYDEKGKETFITVTAEGKRHIRKFQFDAMRLSPPKRWDAKWRIVTFDIPEKKARERKVLRDKLRDLGFYQLQKSVWVFPHDCRDEIDFIVQFLGVDRCISYLETNSLERKEGEARRIFGLL